jgi:hypothetical protein
MAKSLHHVHQEPPPLGRTSPSAGAAPSAGVLVGGVFKEAGARRHPVVLVSEFAEDAARPGSVCRRAARCRSTAGWGPGGQGTRGCGVGDGRRCGGGGGADVGDGRLGDAEVASAVAPPEPKAKASASRSRTSTRGASVGRATDNNIRSGALAPTSITAGVGDKSGAATSSSSPTATMAFSEGRAASTRGLGRRPQVRETNMGRTCL